MLHKESTVCKFERSGGEERRGEEGGNFVASDVVIDSNAVNDEPIVVAVASKIGRGIGDVEDSSAFISKNKNMVAVQCPVWHCTAIFQEVERFCRTARSSLS